MHRLTESERPHYDRWLRHFADGDPRLLALLEASLGRIAAGNLRGILDRRGGGATMKLGDLPSSKPWPEDIVGAVAMEAVYQAPNAGEA